MRIRNFIACIATLFATTTEAKLSFLAIGDWGGLPKAPFYTTAQQETASGMASVATQIAAEFVVALGDNFYSAGVTSASSARFQDTWSDIYLSYPSLNKKWYVIAGNHDHEGSVQAQIDFSKSNPYWTFPSLYYVQSFKDEASSATLDMILIDTVDLSGASAVTDSTHPAYFAELPAIKRSLRSTQWTWIEDQLKRSTADYVIVAGHYPVYSPCEHGPTATLVTNLKPLLEKYGAHYVAGHDHCMSHVKETTSNYVQYFNTGTGVECCYKASNLKKCPASSVAWHVSAENRPSTFHGGFTSFEVSGSSMDVQWYDQNGAVLYSVTEIPPRHSMVQKKDEVLRQIEFN